MSRALLALARAAAALAVAAPVIAFFARGALAAPGPIPPSGGVLATTLGSIVLGGCAAAGAMLLGAPAALVLARRSRATPLVAALVLLPLVVPSYVLAIGWYPLLGAQGALGGLFHTPPLYTPLGAGLVQAFQLWPIPALLGAAALRRADARLEESAKLLAGRSVALRLAAPGLGAGFAIAFALAVGDFGVSGSFNLATVPEEIYARYSTLLDARAAAAAAVPLVVALPALLYFAGRAAGRIRVGEERPWRGASTLAWCGLAAVVAVALGIPGAHLVRTAGGSVLGAWKGHSAELVESLRAAGLAVAVAGTLAAIGSGRRGRGAVEVLFLLPFALPGVVTGIGIYALDRATKGALRGALGAEGLMVAALAARVAWVPWKAIDLSLAAGRDAAHEAARVHGAGGFRRWRGIDVPRALPGLIVGLAAAFILAIGEVGAVALLMPPGEMTLSLRIFDLIHYGYDADVASLCLLLAACVLAAGGLAAAAAHWRACARRSTAR